MEDDDSTVTRMEVQTNKEPSSSETRVIKTNVDCQLTSLPDDILLVILSFLPHDSLISLMKTCKLFARIGEDYTLWRNVSSTDRVLSAEEFQTFRRLLNSDTTSLKIGNGEQLECSLDITADLLKGIHETCGNLNYLGLISQRIDPKTVLIQDFPKTLTVLNLSGSFLNNLAKSRFYFNNISVAIPNLKILKLSGGNGFLLVNMVPISKCRYLEELTLVECKLLTGYREFARSPCFYSLHTLVILKSHINTSDICTFIFLPQIRHLYLENAVNDLKLKKPDFSSLIVVLLSWESDGMGLNFRPDWFDTKPPLEKLALRNFHSLTDKLFLMLAQRPWRLRCLDITGSAISLETAANFKKLIPHVKIVDELRSLVL